MKNLHPFLPNTQTLALPGSVDVPGETPHPFKASLKSLTALSVMASNRVLTAVGQANFTMSGFTAFISRSFHTPDFSITLSAPLFLITSIPRAIVTSISQGSALVLPNNQTAEEELQRNRVAGFDKKQMFFYQLAKAPAAIAILFCGMGTFKFVSVFCEKLPLFIHAQWNIHAHPVTHYGAVIFAIFSAFCAMGAYSVYTYDQALKGAAKLLAGDWRNYSIWTKIITLIHILGRAVFARYVIYETVKNSNSPLLILVLPNLSALTAVCTDFLSNIHTIHDLNVSLRKSIRRTIIPKMSEHLSLTTKVLCTLTMILGLIDSLNYGFGTLMTGTNALSGFLGFKGFYLCLFVFAPVSVFVNYAFNVRKGVFKFIEASTVIAVQKKGPAHPQLALNS